MNIRCRTLIASALVPLLVLAGCATARDDPAGRELVVELIKAGQLHRGEGYDALALPADLAHVSTDGEVVGLHDGDAWTIVFFDFRGANHYTGWVYSETPLVEDPLGNVPFKVTPLGNDWYVVDAG